MALHAALHPWLEEEGGDDEFMPKKVGSRDALQTSPDPANDSNTQG